MLFKGLGFVPFHNCISHFLASYTIGDYDLFLQNIRLLKSKHFSQFAIFWDCCWIVNALTVCMYLGSVKYKLRKNVGGLANQFYDNSSSFKIN